MRLALRLGRTLSELRHSLSASEAMMWMEFDRVSPLGDERGDIRNAQIVKAVFGAQGMNVALKDAMLAGARMRISRRWIRLRRWKTR